MKTYETQIQHIEISDSINGSILDIGGGGEGIIGQAYGNDVVSIDKRQDELDEAPSNCKKILMDASDLQFENECFDNVTSFFTLMYIPKDTHTKVISEAYRVLKKSGKLYLWDVEIPKNTDDYQIFIIHLNVKLQSKVIATGYGVAYNEQNLSYYENLLSNAGFKIELSETNNKTYKLIAVKG